MSEKRLTHLMSLPLQPLDLGDFVRGQHLGEHPRDASLIVLSSSSSLFEINILRRLQVSSFITVNRNRGWVLSFLLHSTYGQNDLNTRNMLTMGHRNYFDINIPLIYPNF